MPGLDYYLIAWDSSASVSLKVFRMLTVLKPAILNKWLKIQDLFLNFLALIKTKKREGERKTEILESNNVNWCWKKKRERKHGKCLEGDYTYSGKYPLLSGYLLFP